MGAAGARYGLASVGLFALGSIPAMLFAGLFLMPIYYGANSGPQALSGPGAVWRELPRGRCRSILGCASTRRRGR